GITMIRDAEADPRKFLPEFQKIENGSIEHHADLAAFGHHRLTTGFREVEDGESAMAEDGVPPAIDALRVGSAPQHGAGHPADRVLEVWQERVGSQTGYAAHDMTPDNLPLYVSTWQPVVRYLATAT